MNVNHEENIFLIHEWYSAVVSQSKEVHTILFLICLFDLMFDLIFILLIIYAWFIE